MKIALTLFFLLIVILPISGQDFMPWVSIRNSAYTLDNNIHIRAEIINFFRPESDFFYNQGSGWLAGDLNLVDGITYETIVPVNPDLPIYGRFRTVMDNDFIDIPDLIPGLPDSMTLMMTGFLPDNPSNPSVADLAHIADDPIGDIDASLPADLDLTGQYFSYSDERFFSALTNNSGAFPTGPLWGPFNIYASMLINPETALTDTVFYAMVYAQIPILLGPGLYRVSNLSNPGLDSFQQIGSITHQVVGNTLIKSCSISDLVNDPGFGTWPNFSNTLVTVPMTMRVSLTMDVVFGDVGQPGVLFFDHYLIEPFDNSVPILSNIEIYDSIYNSTINVTYFDQEANFPLVAELETMNGDVHQFLPLGNYFLEPIVFTTTVPLDHVNGVIRFSDNGHDFVEHYLDVSIGKNPSEIELFNLSVFPNPFKVGDQEGGVNFQIRDGDRSSNHYKVSIYNIKGQLVKTLSTENSNSNRILFWNGLDGGGFAVSSGIYLVRLTDNNNQSFVNRKLMVIR